MPNNYILLETIALTQSAASVTFDNLPTSGYTDLKIVASARDNRSAVASDFIIGFNGVTTNLSFRRLYGDGSSAISTSGSFGSAGIEVANTATANTFSNVEITIPNYRSSNFKSYSVDSVSENNATTAYAQLTAGLWSNTAAITSITFTAESSSSFLANSTFSLYGVAALGTTPVLAPKATGGNIVANDGTYWYHAFLSSGNFVPQTGLTADVLVVAGGGGGGCDIGGGGGAGGVLGFASQSLGAANYSVTIGGGGTGGLVGNKGGSGVASTFQTLTSTTGGGGAGGNQGGANGIAGGSGGGAGYQNGTGGAASPSGQGNAGASSGGLGAGGGGGLGAVGGSPDGVGNGGNGGTSASTVTNLSSVSTWLSATGLGVSGTFAGGGGGASGASQNGGTATGGGGAGARNATGNSGGAAAGGTATANTGSGGGGGSSYAGTGGSGGSGIVIIRYPIA